MSSRNLPRLTLVLGGARSGKSTHAEGLLMAVPGPWIYLATGQALDDEMHTRIGEHRARRGAGWRTVEVPVDLSEALRTVEAGRPVLVDCLTLWLTNVMLGGHDMVAEANGLLETLATVPGPCVIVANEVGLGIVPDNALARSFRDEAGRLNQRVAAVADRVVFMVAGLPMTVKG